MFENVMLYVRAAKSDRPYMPAPLVFRPRILLIVAPTAPGKQESAKLCLKSRKLFLDRVSTGSGSDLVSHQHANFLTFLTPMVHQVATAPCTDPFQVRFLLLRQSRMLGYANSESRFVTHFVFRAFSAFKTFLYLSWGGAPGFHISRRWRSDPFAPLALQSIWCGWRSHLGRCPRLSYCAPLALCEAEPEIFNTQVMS